MIKDISKKDKILSLVRLLIFIVVACALTFLCIRFLPTIAGLSDETKGLQFKEQVGEMGFKGVLIVLGLQILQIVFAVIPGQPVEIISGMIYGVLPGMVLCLVGIFIGTFIVFYTVRKIGTDFIQLFFSKEKINEIKDTKIFKNTTKFEILVFIIFIIPLIPKDIFIYLGGISPIRAKRFLFIATIARIPSLFFTVYAGNNLSEGNLGVTIVVFVAVTLIGLIGIYASNIIRNRLESES